MMDGGYSRLLPTNDRGAGAIGTTPWLSRAFARWRSGAATGCLSEGDDLDREVEETDFSFGHRPCAEKRAPLSPPAEPTMADQSRSPGRSSRRASFAADPVRRPPHLFCGGARRRNSSLTLAHPLQVRNQSPPPFVAAPPRSMLASTPKLGSPGPPTSPGAGSSRGAGPVLGGRAARLDGRARRAARRAHGRAPAGPGPVPARAGADLGRAEGLPRRPEPRARARHREPRTAARRDRTQAGLSGASPGGGAGEAGLSGARPAAAPPAAAAASSSKAPAERKASVSPAKRTPSPGRASSPGRTTTPPSSCAARPPARPPARPTARPTARPSPAQVRRR